MKLIVNSQNVIVILQEGCELLKQEGCTKEENRLLLARADRLFKETVGEIRDEIRRRTDYFLYILGTQDEYRIMRFRKGFSAFLTFAEARSLGTEFDDESVDDFAKWYEEQAKDADEDETSRNEDFWSEEELFEEWKKES